ncbi:hypothetical protein D3C72_1637800 [compost metagenome]
MVVQGVELVAEGHDKVFRNVRGDGQLQGNMRIEAVLELAHHAAGEIEIVKWQQRNHAVQRRFTVVPDAPIVTIVQPHPAELGRKRRAFAQQGLVFVTEHAAGIQCALEQLTAFPTFELVAAVLAAGLIERRKQAQDADIVFLDEARRFVKEIVE